MAREAREGEFKVTYEVDDGYTGGSCPQSFVMSLDDIDPGMTDEQLLMLLYDAATEDMQQKVSASVSNANEFVAWARERINRNKESE